MLLGVMILQLLVCFEIKKGTHMEVGESKVGIALQDSEDDELS